MNKRQKEVQQAFLESEKEVLSAIKKNYRDALKDIDEKIESLLARQDSDMQYVIYQVEYQKALKAQVEGILDQLHSNEFATVSDYLTKSYENGFIGTLYDLQGQGIPLIFPIDQSQVVDAIQHDTKLSESLYSALGKDIKELSKQIASEISRGISTGAMYADIARNIKSYSQIPQNNAMRIARTEAHRIQCQATADAQHKAKEKGADVVKQWDSTLDSKTRETHRELDGQIRELEEPFEVAGMKAMQPGGFGRPEEDINCRCALLQRARWALGNDFTKWSPDAPIEISDDGTTQFFKIEADKYDKFKEYYQDIISRMQNIEVPEIKDKVILKAYDDFNTVLINSEGTEMMVNRIIMASDTVDFVEDHNLPSAFAYIPDEDVIKYNSNIKNFELYDLNFVQAHELSHRVDVMEIQSWKNPQFLSAIEKSRQIVEENRETIIKWFEDGGKYEEDVAISDIISALSYADMNKHLIAGHRKEYWDDPQTVPLEIFANIASIDIVGYDSKIELETMFSDLFDAYKVIVR